MVFENVNLVAVLVAAIAYFAIGMLWYSPALFAKQWMKLAGIKASKKKESMAPKMILGFVAHLVLVYILSGLFGLLNVTTASAGAIMAFWIWLGFFATTQLGSFLWEKKPFNLYILNTSYMLVALVVVGLILGAF